MLLAPQIESPSLHWGRLWEYFLFGPSVLSADFCAVNISLHRRVKD